ncbi:MAG: 50S ribosomal protein L10 [Candidatus Firestonebacteria bacterium]|nr:50S ribosomal protein L10 [Candidatus Firestonebacteria bacterium]
MLKRAQKEAKIKEIQQKISGSNSSVFTDYKGLSVANITQLRTSLRKVGTEYKVYKNTLSSLAYKGLGFNETEKLFKESTAIAFCKKDPSEMAKVLADFQKQNEIFKIKGGTLGNKVLSSNDIKVLASLPSKEVLIAKMLGSMNAPIVGLVNVLQGNIRNLCYALKAIEDNKKKAA